MQPRAIAVSTFVLQLASATSCAASEATSAGETDEQSDEQSDEQTDTGAPVEGGDYPCRAQDDGKTTAVFVNRCADSLEVRGSDIQDASVAPDAFVCRDLGTADEPLSSKRYWGFIGQDPGAEHHTLAEFTFNTDFNDFDWYNISHVDAHNLPMSIIPLDRADCDTLTCADTALLTDCPEVGRLLNDQAELVACVSPERDNPTSPVALYFESCDDAYAWSGDDQQGEDPSPVRACAGEDWAIVFCP